MPTGHAIRILTGALLPDGVDTIVLEEDCQSHEGRVAFTGPVKKGANTRKAGEDVAKDALVLTAGRRLTPADLALLSAVGVAQVGVRTPLRVGILSTGDEIAASGSTADAAVTFDANRPMLSSMIRSMGFQPIDLGHVGDDPTALAATLDNAAADCHATITSGGASAGDEDHVARVLGEQGNMTAWRIAVKPGRPLALANWRGHAGVWATGESGRGICLYRSFCPPCPDGLGGRRMG